MMCFERPTNPLKWVSGIAMTARESPDAAAKDFSRYVRLLGGNFNLAVNNVGALLFDKVLGCESGLTQDDQRKYPNLKEAITQARSILNPQAPIMSHKP